MELQGWQLPAHPSITIPSWAPCCSPGYAAPPSTPDGLFGKIPPAFLVHTGNTPALTAQKLCSLEAKALCTGTGVKTETKQCRNCRDKTGTETPGCRDQSSTKTAGTKAVQTQVQDQSSTNSRVQRPKQYGDTSVYRDTNVSPFSAGNEMKLLWKQWDHCTDAKCSQL